MFRDEPVRGDSVVGKRLRLAVLAVLLVASCIVALDLNGLIDRWYGRIIGDAIEVRSERLTAFRGEPVHLRAFVIVPLSAEGDASLRYPVLYHLHGFGGDYMEAAERASKSRISMQRHPEIEMIHVHLDASLGDGYHYFVNSENTGPWEDALVHEFIPEFERRFPVASSARARFLTGHSSGGWSALWLQVNHPDLFHGVWSVAPDPVDFASFFDIDVRPTTSDNFYRTRSGTARMAARSGKLRSWSIERYAALEGEVPSIDGDLGSYEWAWSPPAVGGLPRALFDRRTGVIDVETARAWEKFDIKRVLQSRWDELGPKLDRKLHLFCGSDDDFFLDKPFRSLCAFLAEKRRGDACELVTRRGHATVYAPTTKDPIGLEYRIEREVRAAYEE